jgi:phospholipase C
MKTICTQLLRCARTSLVWLVLLQLCLGGLLPASARADEGHRGTTTPIKHVIIIVGENRSFDHVFATYKPKHGQYVDNLLSKGIVNEDGTPGPHYSLAHQFSADVTGGSKFQLSPMKKSLFSFLPAPLNGGPTDVCKNNGICSLGDATASENGLSDSPVDYYEFMTTGGSGLTGKVPDSRIDGVHNSSPYTTLPWGPFQYSNGKTFTWDSYAASPVHRFYQMWQQADCNASYATHRNPSGCKADLFAWTEVTVGSNVNGVAQPSNFSTEYSPTATTTGEGATAMGFITFCKAICRTSRNLPTTTR